MKSTLAMSAGLLLLSTVSFADGGIIDELTDSQKADLDQGNQVVITNDVAGSAWPDIIIYQKSDNKPLEIISVFADYAIHKDMFADMPKSDPRPIDRFTTEVDYTMTFPPVLGITIKPENYTVSDVLSRCGADNQSYCVSWTKVKTDSIKDIIGQVSVENYGDGAIIKYDSLISPPKPALARLLTQIAIQKVRDTVSALNARVSTEKKDSPEVLQAQVQKTLETFASGQSPVSGRTHFRH